MRPMTDERSTDPKRLAQANMRTPEIKRFFREASVAEVESGWALKLDGRAARTPGKAALIAPYRAIAELIAAEWNAQGEVIRPHTMPATRLANSAIDGVAKTMNETRAEIVRYAGSDLLYYRAEMGSALAALQAKAFDPILAFVEGEIAARFFLSDSLIHVAQPEATLARFASAIEAFDDSFAVAALATLTTLSGSALLAFALARGAVTAESAWAAAHVDEDFQIAKWGEDDEAVDRRAARWKDFDAAGKVLGGIVAVVADRG